MGLSSRQHHHPLQLSGGEQQRVAIAVALANRPLILLADEPTGEVDSATALEIYAALRKVNQTYRTTTLIVSHDLNLSKYTDRVVAIRDGKTSTETVRTGTKPSTLKTVEQPKQGRRTKMQKPVEFEELVVLDSAGRLQLPREYLEALDIGDRVHLELKESNIIVSQVAGRGRVAAPKVTLPSPEELYIEEDAAPEEKSRSTVARLVQIAGKFNLDHISRKLHLTQVARKLFMQHKPKKPEPRP
jgi:ABC-type glutathione transport system ATPase component